MNEKIVESMIENVEVHGKFSEYCGLFWKTFTSSVLTDEIKAVIAKKYFEKHGVDSSKISDVWFALSFGVDTFFERERIKQEQKNKQIDVVSIFHTLKTQIDGPSVHRYIKQLLEAFPCELADYQKVRVALWAEEYYLTKDLVPGLFSEKMLEISKKYCEIIDIEEIFNDMLPLYDLYIHERNKNE